mmetsp:Transcript_4174/g.7619  ORF Transcript_4174/g.7619 Transcript_4174/m.7619 type:complete len:152 (-) Transcript_4174:35-490(-)
MYFPASTSSTPNTFVTTEYPAMGTTKRTRLKNTAPPRVPGSSQNGRPPELLELSSDAILKEEDDDDEDPVEVFLAMEEASKRTTSRLMLPRMIATSISQSVTYAAYAFLIFCFALNVAGYSLINDGKGTLSIGTFEERAFQIEVAKSAREN